MKVTAVKSLYFEKILNQTLEPQFFIFCRLQKFYYKD